MEVDCDHRVLRAGADARDYSKALLTVGQRGLGAPFGALALTEPVSELERRIRIMLDKARDFSLAGFGARFLVVVSVLGLAVAVNAPKAQQAADSGEAASTPEVLPVIRLSIGEQISEAQACIKQEDMECAHRILDEIGETPDLNAYEAATLQNLLAYTDYQEDNLAGAITAYETILALPQDGLPEGLVSAAMRSLSILYVGADRLQDGLYLYDRYLALPYVDASGEDYFLKASILYQLERYPDALAETERAIATTDEPREAWYELLYGLQSTTGDEQGAARTLEILNTRWPNEERASSAAAAAPERSTVRGGDFGLSDGEYLPVFIAQPIYPPRARARGLEGYVVVRYTVTTTGTPKDIEVIESSTPTLFDHAAIEAVRQYEYKPRVVDGIPVEVAGVTSRIVFDGTL
jgi:TonB family protein